MNRAMDTMKERNKRYLESQGVTEEESESGEDKPKLYDDGTFEKGDIPAIIISAFLVFGPIFIILGIIIFLAMQLLR